MTSENIYNLLRTRHSKTRNGPCKFNKEVECDRIKPCYKCGWNPKVESARKEQLRGKKEVWFIGNGTCP